MANGKQGMSQHIPFRMINRGLRDAVESVEFRQHESQRRVLAKTPLAFCTLGQKKNSFNILKVSQCLSKQRGRYSLQARTKTKVFTP